MYKPLYIFLLLAIHKVKIRDSLVPKIQGVSFYGYAPAFFFGFFFIGDFWSSIAFILLKITASLGILITSFRLEIAIVDGKPIKRIKVSF